MDKIKTSFFSSKFFLKFGFVEIFIIKVFVAGFFSSDYSNKLFIPFVQKFLEFNGNPWDFFANAGQLNSFPYPSGMLIILAIPVALLSFFKSLFIRNLLFKSPFFLADYLIYKLLLELAQNKKAATIFYYLSSPIIIYAIYMHSQLDLIPTALLFLSIVLLFLKNLLVSSLIFGCTILTKTHAIEALPLVFIYVYKKYSFGKSIKYIASTIGLFVIGTIPF